MIGTKFSRYLILIMFPAVVWLFTNTIVNRHIHVLSGGYIIVHAHPYAKTQTDPKDPNPHKHTPKELFLLDLFFTIIFSSIAALVVQSFLNATPRLSGFRMIHQVPVRKYFQVYHYHAPPFPG
jgi:hypothetical protein